MSERHDYDDDLCTCGHVRMVHSIMATRFVDIGCTQVVRPLRGPSYECPCARYVRGEQQTKCSECERPITGAHCCTCNLASPR